MTASSACRPATAKASTQPSVVAPTANATSARIRATLPRVWAKRGGYSCSGSTAQAGRGRDRAASDAVDRPAQAEGRADADRQQDQRHQPGVSGQRRPAIRTAPRRRHRSDGRADRSSAPGQLWRRHQLGMALGHRACLRAGRSATSRSDTIEVRPILVGIRRAVRVAACMTMQYVLYSHTPMTTVHPIATSHPRQPSASGSVRP